MSVMRAAAAGAIPLVLVSTSCADGNESSENFIRTGQRIASSPETCSDARITHYERVKTKWAKDGEDFKLIIGEHCRTEWMDRLGDNADFSCDEDRDPAWAEAPPYFCYSGDEPLTDGTTVTFYDDERAELLWITPK